MSLTVKSNENGNFKIKYLELINTLSKVPSNYIINNQLMFNKEITFTNSNIFEVNENIKLCEKHIIKIVNYRKYWDKLIKKYISKAHEFRLKYENNIENYLIIDSLILRANKSIISLKLFGEQNIAICKNMISRLSNLKLVLQNMDNGQICLDCYYNINYRNSIYLECSRCKKIKGLCEGCFNSSTCNSVSYTSTKDCCHILCKECYEQESTCDFCTESECPICYSTFKKSEMIKTKCDAKHLLCKGCHNRLKELKCEYFWTFGRCNKRCNSLNGCDHIPTPKCPLCRGQFI